MAQRKTEQPKKVRVSPKQQEFYERLKSNQSWELMISMKMNTKTISLAFREFVWEFQEATAKSERTIIQTDPPVDIGKLMGKGHAPLV